MTVVRYFLSMLAVTVLCWAAFLLVLVYIDPTTSGWIGLACFYISLFLALMGTLALVGFVLRSLLWRSVLPYRHVGVSLRQGLLVAFLVDGALLLAAHDLFVWWSMALVIAGVGLLEFFFLSQSLRTFDHSHLADHHGN